MGDAQLYHPDHLGIGMPSLVASANIKTGSFKSPTTDNKTTAVTTEQVYNVVSTGHLSINDGWIPSVHTTNSR